MNKLKIKYWLCLLSVIMCIALFQGCGGFDGSDSAQYTFIEPVQVVEVDADTKSFRIVLKYLEGEYVGGPYVFLDTLNTTARHNEHFINHIEQPFENIGGFTPMDSDNMFYKDIMVLSEGIKDEVTIYYELGNIVLDGLNDKLKVILRPKTTNN